VAEREPGRRVFVEDFRDNGAYLRATWHPDRAVVVLSHWQGDICRASTAIPVAEGSKLIELLVTALRDAAVSGTAPSPVQGRQPSLRDRLRGLFRTNLAEPHRLPAGRTDALRTKVRSVYRRGA
jgi:hypothetical protein